MVYYNYSCLTSYNMKVAYNDGNMGKKCTGGILDE
ncbi:hypothetical protein SAMN04490247_0257 [Salimicrobium halophilum]|uniref:Uncharacterized protein n=1 Tax=Salimicrobium halophilum TaxID=86666 RepID=A0A1G8PXD3_9BACI|nr:hypothetical protein SAMN04490247_0257 [Salimicrobium halophilum]